MKSTTISMNQQAYTCDIFWAFTAGLKAALVPVEGGVAGDYFEWVYTVPGSDGSIRNFFKISRANHDIDNELYSCRGSVINYYFQRKWAAFTEAPHD